MNVESSAEPLRQQYRAERGLLITRVKRARWAVALFLVLIAVTPAVATPALLLALDYNTRTLHLAYLAPALAANAALLIYIGTRAFLTFSEFPSHIRNGRVRALQATKDPGIEKMVRALESRMGIEPGRCQLVQRADPGNVLPSVDRTEGRDFLVIPARFIMEFLRNPEAASAMVAHELGHILHQDASLWRWSELFARSMRLVIPSVLLTNVYFAWWLHRTAHLPLTGRMILVCGCLFALVVLFVQNLRRLRMDSEMLADCVAFLETGRGALEQAIKKCRGNALWLNQRLAWVEQWSGGDMKNGPLSLRRKTPFPLLPFLNSRSLLAIPVTSAALLCLVGASIALVRPTLVTPSQKQAYDNGIRLGAEAGRLEACRGWRSHYHPTPGLTPETRQILERIEQPLVPQDREAFEKGFEVGFKRGYEKAFKERLNRIYSP